MKKVPSSTDPTARLLERLVDPKTGYIDLRIIYEGRSLFLRDDPALPLEAVAPKERLALWRALAQPGLKGEPPVEVPLDKGRYLQSGMGYYRLLGQDPRYPFHHADLQVGEKYRNVFANFFRGANLVETCVGTAEKTLQIVNKSGVTPPVIIKVDTLADNLEDSSNLLYQYASGESFLIDLLGDCMREITWQRPKLPVSSLEEDDLDNNLLDLGDDEEFYDDTPWDEDNDDPKAVTIPIMEFLKYKYAVFPGIEADPWKFYQEDILQALRNDPARTVYLMLGVSANDFPLPDMLQFLKRNFKEGTVFLLSVDNTTDTATLKHIYDLPVIKQLILNGVIQYYWKNRNKPKFSGLSVQANALGAKITIEKTPHGATVFFNICAKDNPYETMTRFDPIDKYTRKNFAREVKKAGMEIVMHMPSKNADRSLKVDHAIYALCHAGHGRNLKRLALGG